MMNPKSLLNFGELWTPEEDAILFRYRHATFERMEQELPGRSLRGITARRTTLGITTKNLRQKDFDSYDNMMWDDSRNVIRDVVRNDPGLAKYQVYIRGEV